MFKFVKRSIKSKSQRRGGYDIHDFYVSIYFYNTVGIHGAKITKKTDPLVCFA